MTLQWLHWPSVFHIFGTLGVLWYFVWEWRSASAPDEDDRCSQAEKDLLAKNTVERVGPQHCDLHRLSLCGLGISSLSLAFECSLQDVPCHLVSP